MKTVILAGGLGTRLKEETEFLPKPMVPIGGKPILWHIMKNYSVYDHNQFVICAGYKSEVIKQYFRDFELINRDFTIQIQNEVVIEHHGDFEESGWQVTIADTGPLTLTGARIANVRRYIGDETFFCTYGDGVANIDFDKLLEFHNSHGKIATLTAVRPLSRFGVLDLGKEDKVNNFKEKPEAEGWINAGFFVFDARIFDYLIGDVALEREPLSKLAEDNELMAYKHDAFWQPMDTLRESQLLNELWRSTNPPWKMWG
jgi:glucose-1-phosphate cytidylyltransferase